MNKLLILAILSISLTSYGQSVYTVTGKIVDGPKGRTIDYASIVLLDSANNSIGKQVTDDEGRFRLVNVYAGHYSIRVNYIGYQDTIFRNITVSADTMLTLDIHRFCRYDASIHNKTCPTCNKRNKVIPVVYGLMVSINGTNPWKGENKTFKSGGCVISNCDPRWYCKRDKTEF